MSEPWESWDTAKWDAMNPNPVYRSEQEQLKELEALMKSLSDVTGVTLPPAKKPRDPVEVIVELEDKFKAMTERQEELELELSELEERVIRMEREREQS
jgi:hypothetical protein